METMSLGETLSWIAFRRRDHLFKNPAELRRVMAEHPERVRCKRPARELLKKLRDGTLPAPFGTFQGYRLKMSDVDWAKITEDQIWRQAKADYQRRIQTSN